MNAQPGQPQQPQPGREWPAKSLRALLDGLATVGPRQERDIGGLSLDSRRVTADDLFIAVPGTSGDGRDYIQQAVRNGAAAVVREKFRGARSGRRGYGVPNFDIAALNGHIGAIAARFFEHPSEHLRLIGITGTNGKTTCAYLLAQALDRLGRRCALMSTIGTGFVGSLRPATLTTADAISTQRTLAALRAGKAEAVCVEVSSHGLEQGRVNRVAFDVAVLTNLSRDHLDYHGDMERYACAKQKLFQFDGLHSTVINLDDPFGRRLLDAHGAAQCLGYGLHGGDLRPRNLALSENGIAFDAEYRGRVVPVRSTLIGALNVPNLLAVIATLICCGYELEPIAAAIGKCLPPPGRMELLRKHPSQPAVIVDYAHTPDALERALGSLAELCTGKLWVVFGCGGERDRGKRPLMGRVAESLADHVIVTNDNPRTEKPEQITAQIMDGMVGDMVGGKDGGKDGKPTIIHDRRRAIETAVLAAAAEDIVLVAGKGHETTQTVGQRVIELNDRDIVTAVLARMSGERGS